jgi:flagellar hook-associated protein 2
MGSMGIDGIASGLDTTSLINQLMQVEAMPQTLLKTKVTTTGTFISALQSLNTRISSLADAGAAAAKPASWSAVTSTSSAPSVTTTTTAGATPASLSVRVEKLAQSQVSLTAQFTDASEIFGSGVPVKFSLTSGGKTTAIEAKSSSLADITAAINATGTGATATAIRVTDGAVPTYRLQISGTATGSDATFSVTRADTGADVPLTTVQSAQDAQIRLFGTATDTASVPVTSKTNSFAGVVPGLTFTVSKVEADPVTVSVARDDAALKKLASDIVGTLGVVVAEVKSRTATTTTTTDGRTVVTGGPLSGDSAVRGVNDALLQAVSYPVNGSSPNDVGIVLGRDGTVTFDEAKFTAAMAADPAKVQSMVTAIGDRVATAAKGMSDPYTGSLTSKITTQQSYSRDLSNQVDEWDRRLDLRRSSLQATYTALEVALSGMQSQSSWLSGQLSSLAASS